MIFSTRGVKSHSRILFSNNNHFVDLYKVKKLTYRANNYGLNVVNGHFVDLYKVKKLTCRANNYGLNV
jgi:hypothetical protein